MYHPDLDITIDELWPMFKRQHKITDEQEIAVKPLLEHWLNTTTADGELLTSTNDPE